MLIDTHAHLMFEAYDKDLDKVIERLKHVGVEKVVNVGYDIETSEKAVKMSKDYDFMYATLGLHPYDADKLSEELMQKWEKMIAENKKIVAIGETGLDYYKAETSKEVQQESFRRHLELAKKTGLPVIVHNRDSDDSSLEIIDQVFGDDLSVKIVYHCFGSDRDFARELWKRGIYTSFTGIITFRNADALRDVVLRCPDELLLIETDCPYLAPEGHRSKRNEPSYITGIAHTVSEVKGISVEEVEKLTTENALKFFDRMN